MSARTPGPWRLDYNTLVHPTGTPAAIQVGTLDDMRPVDRAFIVTACNVHDDLVTALEDAHAKLANILNDRDAVKGIGPYFAGVQRAEQMARAALAKVRP